MLDGERLQNRGLSFLRRRRDKGELMEGVKPILLSWPQKGGLRACRRTGCHSLAARGPLKILSLDTKLLLKPKLVFCSSLKMWPVFLSKVICQPPHFSLKPACGQRPWLLSPHPPTLYWAEGPFHHSWRSRGSQQSSVKSACGSATQAGPGECPVAQQSLTLLFHHCPVL